MRQKLPKMLPEEITAEKKANTGEQKPVLMTLFTKTGPPLDFSMTIADKLLFLLFLS